jgi:hypothetical protein
LDSNAINRRFCEWLKQLNFRIAIELGIQIRIISKLKTSGIIRIIFSIEPSFTKSLRWQQSFISDWYFVGVDWREREKARKRENCIEREIGQRSNIECLYDRKSDSS